MSATLASYTVVVPARLRAAAVLLDAVGGLK